MLFSSCPRIRIRYSGSGLPGGGRTSAPTLAAPRRAAPRRRPWPWSPVAFVVGNVLVIVLNKMRPFRWWRKHGFPWPLPLPAPAAACAGHGRSPPSPSIKREERRSFFATNSYASSSTDRHSLKFSKDFVGEDIFLLGHRDCLLGLFGSTSSGSIILPPPLQRQRK